MNERERIPRAIHEVLLRRGWEGLTAKAVAEAAGVDAAAIASQWPRPRDLLIYAVHSFAFELAMARMGLGQRIADAERDIDNLAHVRRGRVRLLDSRHPAREAQGGAAG